MCKALPFTVASISRIIKGIEAAGRFVVGVKPDGTILVSAHPLDTAFLIPSDAQPSPTVETRHAEDYFNGGAREA